MKPLRFLLLAAVPLSLGAGGLDAGELSTFVGPPGGFGDVRVFDELTALPIAQPPDLASVRFLPLDATGRTRLDRLLADRPRLFEDIPGASRIRLPNGVGCLYRFERLVPGGSRFGYALVGADGVARNVFEIDGTGLLGATDPLPSRIAIAPDGDVILAATTVAAGGNLLEIDLLTGTVVDRTANLGPREFEDGGLALVGTWGVGCTPGSLLRFDRTPGALAGRVLFPGAPGWCLGGVACSADGAWMATAMGDDAASADVYVFDAQGAPRLVSDQKAVLSSVGYLPDAPDGPYLALSPDGALCAWRTEVPRTVRRRNQSFVQRQPLEPSREVFIRKSIAAPRASLQLTADARFADTLDDSGVIGFLNTTTLIVLIGKQSPGGVGDADLYQTTLDPATGAALTTTNLSMTSGDGSMPFLAPGDLEPGDELFRLPGSTDILGYASNGGIEELFLLHEGVSGRHLLLGDVKELDFLECAGTHLLAGVRRRNLARRDLVRISTGGAPSASVVGSLPEDHVFTRATARPGTVAYVIQIPGSGELVARTRVATGVSETFGALPQTYGPLLGFSPLGSLLATWETGGVSRFGVWPDATPAYALTSGSVLGFFLPGL